MGNAFSIPTFAANIQTIHNNRSHAHTIFHVTHPAAINRFDEIIAAVKERPQAAEKAMNKRLFGLFPPNLSEEEACKVIAMAVLALGADSASMVRWNSCKDLPERGSLDNAPLTHAVKVFYNLAYFAFKVDKAPYGIKLRIWLLDAPFEGHKEHEISVPESWKLSKLAARVANAFKKMDVPSYDLP